MTGIVWFLPAHASTHYGLLAEAYAHALSVLSKTAPVWGISWNPYWPAGRRGFALSIENALGRHIGFYGPWSLRALRHTIEGLWKEEGFTPQLLQLGPSWAYPLARRWKQRYAATIRRPLPFLAEGAALGLPTTGLPFEEEKEPTTICCVLSPDAGSEAAFLAELLALAKFQIFLVGYPLDPTPLRSAAARFPTRIHLRLGLPWEETEYYALRSAALLLLGKGEELLLRWGRPWICQPKHPLASFAEATYALPQELPGLVSQVAAQPVSALTPEAFVQAFILG
ncbi:MAG: hypothetical protein KatS3mg025_0616 [Bacteroidia bacterium]|nr:MAG: hypothetical protein KatS3mg025_0616 [Bacteroidia bacterium]